MNTILEKFIGRLGSLPEKVSLDTLERCMMEMDWGKLPIDNYVNFSDENYQRNIVHSSEKCEVIVLCLKKGQITPIHDHGGSIGVSIIQEGSMDEEPFIRQPSGMIVPSSPRAFHINELSFISATIIHRISNTHNENLVTINIYFPPMAMMNIYNLENANVKKWVAASSDS